MLMPKKHSKLWGLISYKPRWGIFEPEISVGIISHSALDYDPDAWWISSEGSRKVFSEAIAYFYAKFL